MKQTAIKCFCDRCGKEMSNDEFFNTNVNSKAPNGSILKIAIANYHNGTYVDLCCECEESLVEWWDDRNSFDCSKTTIINSKTTIK